MRCRAVAQKQWLLNVTYVRLLCCYAAMLLCEARAFQINVYLVPGTFLRCQYESLPIYVSGYFVFAASLAICLTIDCYNTHVRPGTSSNGNVLQPIEDGKFSSCNTGISRSPAQPLALTLPSLRGGGGMQSRTRSSRSTHSTHFPGPNTRVEMTTFYSHTNLAISIRDTFYCTQGLNVGVIPCCSHRLETRLDASHESLFFHWKRRGLVHHHEQGVNEFNQSPPRKNKTA